MDRKSIETIGLFSEKEIAAFRNDTTGCNNVIHLNNAGAGLMTHAVTKVQLDHIALEAEIGGYEAAAVRSEQIQRFYLNASRLLNCRPSEIAFTASATDSFTRALSSIPFQKGDIILTDKDDFVSNQIQFLSLQKRIGIEIIHIHNNPKGGVDLNDLEHKLKKHHPRLLAITHIPTNSGLIQPVEAIARLFRDYKQQHAETTWYILDACQSIGQMKLDVQNLECDFLSATCRKFLRGPRGTGLLYIADRVLKAGLEPMFIDMRGAEWIQQNEYRQHPEAKRFEDWEFAYSTVLGTASAIEYCLDVGEEKIRAQIRFLSDYLRKEITSIDSARVLDRGPELGGLVTFIVPKSDPKYIVGELSKRKINVVPSYRAFGVIDFDEKGIEWAVRASPHYYNTLDELILLSAA